jgi:integrase
VIAAGYLADCARRLAPGTVINLARQLQLWQDFAGEATPADRAFTFGRLSDYHVHLQDPETGRHCHGRGPETIRKYIEAVENLWEWAWRRQARGDYHGVPQPDSLELKRAAAPHRQAPTWAQMDAAIACSGGWQQRLYVVLRCTGLRVQQALGLRWDDLDTSGDVWMLRVRPELGKSRQEKRGRTVPVAPVLADVLGTWGTRDGWVVPCERDEREARARDADRAWTRAGVPDHVWDGRGHHAFRAGFQAGLRRAGVDLDAIAHLVGHSRGDVLERYVGPDALPLVEAVRAVPPIAAVSVEKTTRGLRVVQGG